MITPKIYAEEFIRLYDQLPSWFQLGIPRQSKKIVRPANDTTVSVSVSVPEILKKVYAAIANVRKDGGFLQCVQRGAEFQLMENAVQ